jgi:hypothetical protein
MHRRPLLLAAPLLAARPLAAATAAPALVLELFTSQSCSSCPPADALLGEIIAARPDILALSFHVTYWNRLGWRDPFSLTAATERQRRYAATLGHGQVYTPQIVIQGRRDVVGSQRGALQAAIGGARPLARPIQLAARGDDVTAELPAGPGEGQLWLVGYDERHSTEVRAGENGGRRLSHRHVVRSLAPLGVAQGGPARFAARRPEGERVAVLLQGADGTILGAGRAG